MNINANLKQSFMHLLQTFYNDCADFRRFCQTRSALYWGQAADALESCFSEYNITTASGATKGVIIFNDDEYVVKFGFAVAPNDMDYCAVEEYYSNLFEQAGYGDYIAKTCAIGVLGKTTVYLQEQAECNEDWIEDQAYSLCWDRFLSDYGEIYIEHHEQSLRDSFNDSHWDYGDEDGIAVLLENNWDAGVLDAMRSLADINDLHVGNIGLINGQYVLVDYSGYGAPAEVTWRRISKRKRNVGCKRTSKPAHKVTAHKRCATKQVDAYRQILKELSKQWKERPQYDPILNCIPCNFNHYPCAVYTEYATHLAYAWRGGG